MEIHKYPDPILLKKSESVIIDKELLNWIQDFILFTETMKWGFVAGMAAPQVGRNIRVFLALGNIYINPVMTPYEEDGFYIAKEGCYSLKENKFDYEVKRWNTVWLEYYTKKGQHKKITVHNYPAQVIQHEYDHLEGKLCCGDNKPPIQPAGTPAA